MALQLKKNRNLMLPLAVILVAFSLAACNQESSSMDSDTQNDDLRITPVEVVQALSSDISAYYSNTVTLYPKEEATVLAKVRGLIEEIRVEEGDFVQAGDVLAIIEDAPYVIERSRSKAELDRLSNELKRSKELYDKQLIAAETYEEVLYRYEVQKANFELAELNVTYTEIKAPITGTISERLIKKGNMIGVDGPVFEIVQLSTLEAMLYVPEHELYKIAPNQMVQLEVDALPNKLFQARVERISPSIDANTGTFRVTISINQGSNGSRAQELKPGMFGRVKIKYDTRKNATMIPKVAVVNEDRSNTIYIVQDSMAFKRVVELGYEENGWVEIVQGLSADETVITIGQTTLSDSARIEVISSN